MNEFLLEDEKEISLDDYEERKMLYSCFKEMPVEFFSKLRHFQPQIGCLNACSICSKYASNNMAYWQESRIRNVVAALKYATPATQKPLIVWDRDNHRSGVVFSYLDNDVGNYFELNKFVDIVYRELGVTTRISTVGYSRYNVQLNSMHEKIAKNDKALAGVRLSITPYAIGYASCNSLRFSRQDYEEDLANFLRTYKKYYDTVGSGSRNFCVELRYKPLVINSDVKILDYNGKFVIYSDDYLYVSHDKNVQFVDTYINDAHIHRLDLNNEGILFDQIKVDKKLESVNDIFATIESNNIIDKVMVYRVNNSDGYYYSVSPQLTDKGNYGINFYPITDKRKTSGYLILERFFLNALFDYKRDKGFGACDEIKNASWVDVEEVVSRLVLMARDYKSKGDINRFRYIIKEVLPLIRMYVNALFAAGYDAQVFFDKNFTIDTGIICNLGRAISEFNGLVTVENEPVTLNHERNYGKVNSTMVIESDAWRLSCGYDDEVIIEKMNLSKTATSDGQVEYQKRLKLVKKDRVFNNKDLENKYLIPGQRNI